MSLVLVTYYLADEMGQGFLHGVAGVRLMLLALVILFLLDSVLGLSIRLLRQTAASS